MPRSYVVSNRRRPILDLLLAEVLALLGLAASGCFIFALIVFVVSGIDDLFFDLYFLSYKLHRALFVRPFHPRLTLERLRAEPERPLAVLVPAWQEAGIIGRSLRNLLATQDYDDFKVFVGTYPNDPESCREVAEVAAGDSRVVSVIVPRKGPTCKADCLNVLLAAVTATKSLGGQDFAGVVLQDAEDVVDPHALRVFNLLLPRFDQVQIPVLPLPRPWWDLTGGHYADEFAEAHGRELLVREAYAGLVPGAGVGTALSRRAIEVASAEGEVFTVGAQAEDYELSQRLHAAGLPQVFARIRLERNGRYELIATREYFPDSLGAAIRQKSRWLIGIVFQGWDRFGWRGDLADLHLWLRDRKALLCNPAVALGHVGLFLHGLIWLSTHAMGSEALPLLPPDSPLWYLVILCLFLLAIRLLQRHLWVGLTYGWRLVPLVIPRTLWGGLINFLALLRAGRRYATHRISGRPLSWEKTQHEYPGLPGRA